MLLPVMDQVVANPLRQNIFGIYAGVVGFREIGWPVKVNNRLNSTGLFEVRPRAVKRRALARQSKHQSQVTTRRSARRTDPLRVEIVLPRVGPQETNRCLHILDRGRKLVSRRQAVGSRGRDKAFLRQLAAEDVFRLLCERNQETLDEPLLTAFLSLLQDDTAAQGDKP